MLERVIPLPEAGDYQVRIGRKLREQERRSGDGQVSEDLNKRHAVRCMIHELLAQGCARGGHRAAADAGRFGRLARRVPR